MEYRFFLECNSLTTFILLYGERLFCMRDIRATVEDVLCLRIWINPGIYDRISSWASQTIYHFEFKWKFLWDLNWIYARMWFICIRYEFIYLHTFQAKNVKGLLCELLSLTTFVFSCRNRTKNFTSQVFANERAFCNTWTIEHVRNWAVKWHWNLDPFTARPLNVDIIFFVNK